MTKQKCTVEEVAEEVVEVPEEVIPDEEVEIQAEELLTGKQLKLFPKQRAIMSDEAYAKYVEKSGVTI